MDNLEHVLPFFRPRSAETTWHIVLSAILFAIGLAVLIGLYIRGNWRKQRELNEVFLDQAATQGLNPEQARFLLHLAQKKRLHNPLSLLSSVYAFDRYLGELATQLSNANSQDPKVDTIAQIRTTLGFDRLPLNHALRSTRQLPSGQTLLIGKNDAPEEYSPWLVVTRDERSIVVAPLLRAEQQPLQTLQAGDSLAVRFWRSGDTEYHFTTQIATLDSQSQTVTLRHANHIERLQQRDFFRVEVRFPILLFAFARPAKGSGTPPPNSGEASNAVETTPFPDFFELKKATPIEGEALDLSAGGLSLASTDKVSSGSLLLIDPAFNGPFSLDGIMCEIVEQTQTTEGVNLQLKFVDLATNRESEIIRQLYHFQIQKRQSQEPPAQVT